MVFIWPRSVFLILTVRGAVSLFGITAVYSGLSKEPGGIGRLRLRRRGSTFMPMSSFTTYGSLGASAIVDLTIGFAHFMKSGGGSVPIPEDIL
jgi:hypothetical protein